MVLPEPAIYLCIIEMASFSIKGKEMHLHLFTLQYDVCVCLHACLNSCKWAASEERLVCLQGHGGEAKQSELPSRLRNGTWTSDSESVGEGGG